MQDIIENPLPNIIAAIEKGFDHIEQGKQFTAQDAYSLVDASGAVQENWELAAIVVEGRRLLSFGCSNIQHMWLLETALQGRYTTLRHISRNTTLLLIS